MVVHINKELRGEFPQNIKSATAKSAPQLTPSYSEGGVWGRRFSNEFIADEATIEEYFFYVVLQPIKDGLVDKISECPGYNCFHDAVWGKASFVGRFRLKQVVPGSSPTATTKTSIPISHRPWVLPVCPEKWAEMRDCYFGILFYFKDVSQRYRRGELTAAFPIGTYRPYVWPG
jgi:hypothetical protein